MRNWLLAIALTMLASLVLADDPVTSVTVTGGPHDLKNVLVSIPMTGVPVPAGVRLVVEDRAGGEPLRAQISKYGRLGLMPREPEITALIGELKANEKRTLDVFARPGEAAAPTGPRMVWLALDREIIEMRLKRGGDKPVARYAHFGFDSTLVPKDKVLTNPTIKPYHHVYDAEGKVLLTNGPDGKFPHHRGIFYGFNRISYGEKKADVWHCRNGEHQQADRAPAAIAGELCGQHRLTIHWNGQDGIEFATEERELWFVPLPGGLLVEFRSHLSTDLSEGVKLDGDPQHAGFHFRANAAVEDVAKQTYFLRPDGKGELGEERNWDPKTKKGPVNLPWNAMSFVLDGKRRTVLYLDHPDNPKEARQSERTYGRIGTYFEHALKPNKPLFVRYRLWIQDGEMTGEQCEAWSRAFVDAVKVERQ